MFNKLTIVVVRCTGNISFNESEEERWEAVLGLHTWSGGIMEGIYFLILWIGSALLHTLYELKVKPYIDSFSEENSGNWPFS
jgi:hypothetical protein